MKYEDYNNIDFSPLSLLSSTDNFSKHCNGEEYKWLLLDTWNFHKLIIKLVG